MARALSLGLVDHIALRSAAIDDALGAGFPQVVLLGAGLDARAYRLPSLADADVFEVDHPASQAAKLARVRDLVPLARSVRHVSADFITDDLEAALAASGHDATIATAWVIEGVTMYLDASVTKRLLDVVGARSADGSLLAMTYLRPPKVPLPPLARATVDAVLDVLGEPLGAFYRPDEVAALLREARLVLRSDTCAVDWSAKFGASATMARVFRGERLAIASR
jgi:methyltransferase (TIGR00027 family)